MVRYQKGRGWLLLLGGVLESLKNVDRLSRAEMQSKEPSPPSRNNRYGSGIKTRLVKLFNKGNTCMEEPKVIEPQRSQGIDHVQTHLSQAINANHGHTRDLNNLPTAMSIKHEGSYLSLDQEQLVASHHTQLAMVTGLCHEEMVLLKQINNGHKDFKDYVSQLDDILIRKVACIESLREKLSKYPTQ
ncbi:Kinesin-like protein kif24 [Desmophyllum pertusum]|uniref:Kinesin-like protein kif24 n=1 Tax=Desmophyllum pertusum TaxID=174260 RepID=A0A9W9ZF30_9CNID|nr:Kinesin-like protein kif24 [Desmophyllum pertusum]